MKEFNDVEYFSDIAKIRLAINKLMKKHNLINEIVMDKALNQVNPFYGRITKNGAFAVEFYCGVPKYLYTPFGKTAIDTGVQCSLNVENMENLFKDLENLFGLKVTLPACKIDGVDKFGPWCTLTKLPWKADEKFPGTFVNATETEDVMCFASGEETMHVNEVLSQVNQNFKKQMEKNEDITVVMPRKKHEFVISAQAREQKLAGMQKEC